MQKYIDLHRHLDGSLRESTAVELARELNIEVPKNLYFEPHMGLDKALDCFSFTLSLLQNVSNIKRVANEICEDMKDENISALEIRFAPQLHQKEGLSIEEIVDAAIEGVKGRAGLILCGLYGEDPQILMKNLEVAISRPQVVGIDLAGGPHSDQQFKLDSYSEVFKKAKDHNIGRTVHASEGRDAEEIKIAVEKLYAQRIGHGTTLLSRSDVIDLVLKNDVTIEACPSSNVHTGAIERVSDHPIAKWLSLGIRTCLNTDNTLFSQTTCEKENKLALDIPNMTEKDLLKCYQNAEDALFNRGL